MTDERVTLCNPATRAMEMRQHVESVAYSIIADHRGDEVFQRVLNSRRHVHAYSSRNRILQAWQAPDSRLVASLGAFERMATEQRAEPVRIRGRNQRVMIRKGARAVWIWGRFVARRNDGASEDDEPQLAAYFQPCSNWAVEDIVYAHSGEPLQLPDFVEPVNDEQLYHRLLEFAATKRIKIEERGLHGARGMSGIGTILLQIGDPIELRVRPLIHELGHELLHGLLERTSLPRHIREGEAEAVLAICMRHFGYDASVSAAYLRNHGTRAADVMRSADRIIRAAGEIIEFVETQDGTAAADMEEVALAA